MVRFITLHHASGFCILTIETDCDVGTCPELGRLFKSLSRTGYGMSGCKAPEVLSREAYDLVR
jgi:hypothetical protein